MKIISLEGLDKKTSGVYGIRNTVNHMIYIGSSKLVKDRISQHKHYLRGRGKDRPTHKNFWLQRDWDSFGEEAFSFLLLEQCSPEQLLQREQVWIDKLKSRNKCYNVTDAIRETLPEEMRMNISKGRLGMKFSEEHKQALSESHIGKTWSQQRRDAHRVGVQDKSLNFEKAQKIREMKCQGKTYSELAIHFNVSERTIYDVVANIHHHDDTYTPAIKKHKKTCIKTMEIIKKRITDGEKVSSLSKEFDVSTHTIYRHLKKGE